MVFIVADNAINLQAPERESKSLQEIIIENYTYNVPIPELVNNQRVLAFQIEGNFTNSGNREILGFYDHAYSRPPALCNVFCFVSDSSGKNIENIYYIDWFGIELLSEEFDFENKTGLGFLGDQLSGKNQLLWKKE